MRVLVAIDKFKHALTAEQACAAAAQAVRDAAPDATVDECPLTDGGEGFAEILTRAVGGWTDEVKVRDPRGRTVSAPLGWVRKEQVPAPAWHDLGLPDVGPEARIAILGLASAGGLQLLEPELRDPWLTSSFGVGQLLAHAAQSGAAAVILGIGGSATHDLALGALSALGWGFYDSNGDPVVPPSPSAWSTIEEIVAPARPTLPALRIACDVQNPLLGPRGAAYVYAPQKGLRPGDEARLDLATEEMGHRLCAVARVSSELMSLPGMGAAGGFGFGLHLLTGAKLLPGAELVGSWLRLDERIRAADVVISGEGRFDAGSLEGKGPGLVVRRALAGGKAVKVFAGSVGITPPPGVRVHVITPEHLSLSEALARSGPNLQAAIRAAIARGD